MKVFVSESDAGRIARTLLFIGVMVLPSIAWVRAHGEKWGFWSRDIGMILGIVTTVLIFTVLAFRTGNSLLKSEMKEKIYQEKLHQAIQSRDEFMSIASHELRTPITGMLLHAQMVKRSLERKDPDAFSESNVIKLVDRVNSGLVRMTRLVEDMLDISRIQSGKLELQLEKIDLTGFTHEILDRYKSQMTEAGIAVRFEGLKELWVIFDRFRMEQVLTNLITNAIRYAHDHPVTIGISVEGKMARLTFKDHGPGISAENLERVFQRFERLISASEVSGLGLGLYITRTIVEAHAGTIHVESRVGEGASFVIELPVGGPST